jgi:hypothetical protein
MIKKHLMCNGLCFLVVLFLGAIVACSDHVAGGGPSGTEAGNALTARIVDADGAPVAGARAYLRPADYIAGESVDSAYNLTTSADGSLRFDSLPAGNWILEVSNYGDALLHNLLISALDSVVDLGMDTLRSQARVRGSIPTPFASGTRVVVLGTGHSAKPDSLGFFTLDSLPAGSLVIRAVQNAAVTSFTGYANLSPATTTQISPLAPEDDYLLLEDFEDKDSRHRFSALTGQGWWFLSNDSSVTILPAHPTFPIPTEYDSPARGTVIHFSVSAPPLASNPWADCGVQLGVKDATYDLSSVDSLVFWARGVGAVIVTLHIADSDSLGLTPQYDLVLSAEWSRISIPMDSITVPQATDPRALKRKLTSISWVFTQNAEFYLDDVMLVGADRESIWP